MLLRKPPRLLHTPENTLAVREAYASTADLRSSGVVGFVLVKLTVASDGTVQSARAIMPPKWAMKRVKAHLIDGATGRELPSPPPHTLQPDLCRAAEAAARKLRFRPATFLGRPVRYGGLRHGFSFD